MFTNCLPKHLPRLSKNDGRGSLPKPAPPTFLRKYWVFLFKTKKYHKKKKIIFKKIKINK